MLNCSQSKDLKVEKQRGHPPSSCVRLTTATLVPTTVFSDMYTGELCVKVGTVAVSNNQRINKRNI